MKPKKYLVKGIFAQLGIDSVMSIIFYFLIPSLMNYAEHSIKYNFVKDYAGVSYFEQAIFMFVPYIIIPIVFLIVYLKDLLKKDLKQIVNMPLEQKKKLCAHLQNTPFILYIIKIVWLPIMVSSILFMAKTPLLVVVKLTLVLSAFFLLNASIIYVLTKNLFAELIKKIGLDSLTGGRTTIRKSALVQFVSMILAGLTFISMLGYSRIIEEVGNKVSDKTMLIMEQYFEDNILEKDEISVLNGLKDTFDNKDYGFFVMYPNGQVKILDDKELPPYMIIHTNKMIEMKEQLNDNRIFNVSKEQQGVIKEVVTDEGTYIYGIFYNIIPIETVTYFIYAIFALMIFNILVVIYYSANMSKNVSEVTEAIEKVVSKDEEVDYNKKLPITSNDEIGDLVVAFNKILDLEKKNVEKIERNQEILVEQERLSSLGQLIGGIAHNLKTPIMSIAGALEGLTDLVKEYDESIEDKQVTNEDHHEIAKEMQGWIDKIRPYLSYMTEVIDTVKGQAVSMNATTMKSFTAEELMSRVKILLRDTLKKKHCNLNLDIQVNNNTYVKGEISAIIQVLDNIIINAVDAYGDNGGDIDLKIYEDETKMYFEIKDTAGGIPESVQERLFKEMITSKGKDGTGLGLYMSYSTVKGKFNGDMRYETEQGVGTTFFIELNKENIK